MDTISSMSRWVRPSEEEADEMREAQEAERKYQERADDERRVHQRVRLEAEVTGTSETNFFTGFTEDISMGGLFISTHCPPAMGTRIEVAIGLKPEQVMLLQGEVVWHRGSGSDVDGCGVSFVEMTEKQTKAIVDLLSELGREPLFYDLER